MTPIKQSELLNSESFLTTASFDVLESHILARAELISELRIIIRNGSATSNRSARRARQGVLKDTVAQELYNIRFMCGVIYSRFGTDPARLERMIYVFAYIIRENRELELEWFQYHLTNAAFLLLVENLSM